MSTKSKAIKLKAQKNLPPADPVREAQQIARLRSLAVTADLDPEFAEKFQNFLVKEVIRLGGDASGLVPRSVLERLQERLIGKGVRS